MPTKTQTKATLILRLSGPIASFGDMPRAVHRTIADAPTKSAIAGLLGACLGRLRGEDLSDLMGLDMATHGPNPKHEIMEDYHTIRDAVTNNGDPGRQGVTVRHYLQDVDFMVEVKGDRTLIEACAEAVQKPYFQPYLGRRACVLTRPMFVEVR